jgi:enamine deaminase RidA (YjgF/YER057c/UK114 family)
MQIQRFDQGARFSQAVVAGGLVYLAGQVADDTSRDVESQTEQVLAKIDRLLENAGTDRTRLTVTIYLADIADFAQMNAAWDRWGPAEAKPARATVESKLVTPAYRVEIQAIAALSS